MSTLVIFFFEIRKWATLKNVEMLFEFEIGNFYACLNDSYILNMLKHRLHICLPQ